MQTPSAKSATTWTLAGYVSAQVIRFGNNLVLSYLIAPEIFGLMALVNVFIQGLIMCSDLGFGICLMQAEEGEDADFQDTAWTLQVLRGVVVLLLALLISWPVAALYKQPQLIGLLAALGLSAVFEGLASTSLHIKRRRLALGKVTLLEVGSQLLSAVAMCVLAYWHASVWALVAGRFVHVGTLALLSHTLGNHRNRFRWDPNAASKLVGFGTWIFIGMVLAFVNTQMDRLTLGALMPLATLGVYSIALSIAMMPPLVIGKIAASVVLPLFSEVNRSVPESLAWRVPQTRSKVLFTGLAMTLIIYGVAPCFFHSAYREEFADAAWMCKLLCVSAWFVCLSKSVDRVLLAIGKPKNLALISLLGFVVSASVSIIGFRLGGVPGFCLGLAVGRLGSHAALAYSLRRNGIPCLRQDATYTALFVLGLSALEIAGRLSHVVPRVDADTAGVLGAALIGVVCLKQVYRWTRSEQGHAAGAI